MNVNILPQGHMNVNIPPHPPTPHVRSIHCCRKFTWTLTSCRKVTWTLTSHPTPPPPTPCGSRSGDEPIYTYYIFFIAWVALSNPQTRSNAEIWEQSSQSMHCLIHSAFFFLSVNRRRHIHPKPKKGLVTLIATGMRTKQNDDFSGRSSFSLKIWLGINAISNGPNKQTKAL